MNQTSLDSRWRLPNIVTALVVAVAAIVLVGACSREPTPTQQPIPTSAPTVIDGQIPGTPTLEQPPVAIEESEMTDGTAVRDMMAALSAEETDCVRDTIGASTFDALQDAPLSDVASRAEGFPLKCLTPENAIDTSIALMSAEAGGLSEKTRSCIRDVAMVNPGALRAGETAVDTPGNSIAAIQMHLCLSDEEYSALASGTDAELPPPSLLGCLVEQMGGLESLAGSFSEEADADTALVLFTAAMNCEETSTVGEIEFGN